MIGVNLAVWGKRRGKRAKTNNKKALKPLSFKAFLMAEKEGFELLLVHKTGKNRGAFFSLKPLKINSFPNFRKIP